MHGSNCFSTDSLKIKYGDAQPLVSMKCLGFQKGFFVPHSDEEGRMESVKDLLKDNIGLLLSNCTALEIIDNEYRIIIGDTSNRTITPFALKTYWKNDKYIEEQIDLSINFKNISDLYAKN